MQIKSDYLFVISPSADIAKTVSAEKRLCLNKVGKFESMNSKAHITVANHFFRKNYEVEELIPYLKSQLIKLPPIEINIRGFDFFDNYSGSKKTIYGKVVTQTEDVLFFDQLRDIVNANAEIIPHITIAKDLSKENFEKLWPLFQDKQWNESFIAERLTILRRNELSDFMYKNIAELKFKSYKLNMSYVYKNARRRITARNSITPLQLGLFD